MSVSQEKIIRILKKSTIFSGLKNHQIISLLKDAESRKYFPKETIFKRGQKSEFLLILIAGKVAIKNDEHVLANLLPLNIMGESSVFLDLPRSVTASSEAETTCLLIHKDVFSEHFAKDFFLKTKIYENLNRALTMKLIRSNNMVASLVAMEKAAELDEDPSQDEEAPVPSDISLKTGEESTKLMGRSLGYMLVLEKDELLEIVEMDQFGFKVMCSEEFKGFDEAPFFQGKIMMKYLVPVDFRGSLVQKVGTRCELKFEKISPKSRTTLINYIENISKTVE